MMGYLSQLTTFDFLVACVEFALALTALIKIKNVKIKLSFCIFSFFSAIWHITLSQTPFTNLASSYQFQLLEIMRYIGLFLVLIYLLMYSQKTRLPAHYSTFMYLIIIITSAIYLFGLNKPLNPFFHPKSWLYIKIILCLMAVVTAEQILRHTNSNRVSKLVALVAITLLSYDILVFSNLLLFTSKNYSLWYTRGMISTTTSLIFALSIIIYPFQQLQDSKFKLSRSIIMFNASFILGGIFLICMATLGLVVNIFNAEWAEVSKILLYVMSIFAIAALSCVEKFRLLITVWISKHFFVNKYDYQKQWIELDSLLSKKREDNNGYEIALSAMTTLFKCNSGGIWLKGQQFYSPVALKNFELPSSGAIEANNSHFIQLMDENEWVFKAHRNTNIYDKEKNKLLPQWYLNAKGPWVIVPLNANQELIGFTVLCENTINAPLTWEDLDILKLTGRQIGSYIISHQTSEKLIQNKQFDLFNKITAFAIHDIKNLISQQSLIVNNAEKFMHHPDFIHDVILTITNSVEKMDQLLVKLKGNPHGDIKPVNINKLLKNAIEMNISNFPTPTVSIQGKDAFVMADKDKLQMVLYHLIRNAQDATKDSGTIAIKLATKNEELWFEIKDSGCGMDKVFIKEKLFKPFSSTKQDKGMGIGAYQIRELIHSLQGEIFVDSIIGKGTTFLIFLPLNNNRNK
ncbi:XrtA/PEP-CTERM system histidine kinase PrsK [Moritella sp. 28]|uniref:XrtA/PEP-CTERM system histidine kinase PrsK n=1 Tax=Moritella sp. 28 TaxID=2746232 RepID=UPI001BA92B0E|nr:XrtA/PEP-CTERM system histidine kinase PrsK [Moritella sp. 28]QUM85355.1 PEP-CTERM system histidine kinase PrsK [Moritella sp. 28]